MDRNVFAMIAGTVFLLFIINAVIQMQTAMVREAAGSVSNDYSESTWETAGMMYVLNHEDTQHFGEFGSTQPGLGDDLDDGIDQSGLGGQCALIGPEYFKDSGPLEITFFDGGDDSMVSNSEDCTNPTGYVRSAPIKIEGSGGGILYPGVERDEG
jgi:hypothetical protein